MCKATKSVVKIKHYFPFQKRVTEDEMIFSFIVRSKILVRAQSEVTDCNTLVIVCITFS